MDDFAEEIVLEHYQSVTNVLNTNPERVTAERVVENRCAVKISPIDSKYSQSYAVLKMDNDLSICPRIPSGIRLHRYYTVKSSDVQLNP